MLARPRAYPRAYPVYYRFMHCARMHSHARAYGTTTIEGPFLSIACLHKDKKGRLASLRPVHFTSCKMPANTVQSLIEHISSQRRSFANEAAAQKGASQANVSALQPTVGHKRKRVEDVPSSAPRADFHSFLDYLLLDVVAAPKTRTISRDSMLEAHIEALSSYAYFFVRSVPLKTHAAQGSGGPVLSRDVVVRMVQTLLAAGGPDACPGAAYPAALLKYLRADLSTARNTLRSEFCDDYDDCRVAVLKAIRDCAKERLGGSSSSSSGGAGVGHTLTARQLEVDALPRTALLCCDAATFARNAVDLLLAISLPARESEWLEGERSSYAAEQIGPQLQAYAAQHGIELQWSPEVLNKAAGTAAAGGSAHGGVKVLTSMADSDDEGEGGEGEGGEGEGEGMEEEDTDNLLVAKMRAIEAKGKTAGQAAPSTKAKAVPQGPAWAQYSTQRKAFSEAWLALLRCPLPPDCLRRVLVALPARILPLFPGRAPLQVADFLRACVDGGGPSALLALESLFRLMQEHGMEYPRFYPSLYALLGQPEATASKYKARFFVLLDLFLSSPALPIYLVCAFAKRLARTALLGGSTPAYARLALAVIHNLHVRHPKAIAPLFHRASHSSSSSSSGSTGGGGGGAWPAQADPWDALSDDPAQCGAVHSSLWEVHALAAHYCAPVAYAAKALTDPSDAARAQIVVSALSGADAGVGAASKGEGSSGSMKKRQGEAAGAGMGYRELMEGEMHRSTKEGVLLPFHWEYARQTSLLLPMT